MVLYIIGLGLGSEKDITVKGLEAVKKSDKIYLEAYTSILGVRSSMDMKFWRPTETPWNKKQTRFSKPHRLP